MKEAPEKSEKGQCNALIKSRKVSIKTPSHRELLDILAEIIAHDIVEKKCKHKEGESHV